MDNLKMVQGTDKPQVYIIILNYNRWSDCIECIEDIFKSTYSNYQIVLIDNNSPNNSINFIESWAKGDLKFDIPDNIPLKNLYYPEIKKPIPYIIYSKTEAENGGNTEKEKELKSLNSELKINPLIIIQTGENIGFGAGNNVALRMILKRNDGDYIWLLNPDRVIENNTLDNLIKFANSNQNSIIGLTVKDYLFPEKIIFYGGSKINPYLGTITHITKKENLDTIDFISGGSLLTCTNNFKINGLLPEEYFLYWEETDWCTKAKMNNIKLSVCLDAVSYDKGSTSIGKGYLAEYYYTHNALKYFYKYNKTKIKFILLANILRITKRFYKLKFQNISAIIKAISDFSKIAKS